MKLNVSVRPRNDLNFVIEQEDVEITEKFTINDYLAQYGEYKELPVSFIADGKNVSRETSLFGKRELIIVVEPQGTFVLVGLMFVMMIASFIFTMAQMNKLKSKTGNNKDTQQGRSIYDVNAQGNKVKLGDIIPEQFGLFKKFPDYLADTHTYYKDNKFYLDLILSQGVGYFLHAANHDDIYIGNTSINSLSGIQCHIAEPGEDLSSNSIDPEITKCWFNSTEVNGNGHTLHSLTSTSAENNVHLEYQSIFVEGYDLSKYRVGDMVKISGADNEWVVLPAFQDVNEHYPEQLSSDWEIRARNNYKNNFDHTHQFAVYPFRPKEMKASDAQAAQGGSPRHSFYTLYVKQRDYYITGSTTASYRLLDIPLNECSVVESVRRWGGEKWELNSAVFNQNQGAWYPSTNLDNYLLLGNNCRHVYRATGGWIPITSYYIYDYSNIFSSSSGGATTHGTVDLQTIPDNCRIDCYSPFGMNADDSVWGYVAYRGGYGSLYQATPTILFGSTALSYEIKINSNGIYKLWNSRMKTNAEFKVQIAYCVRAKVSECHRKDLIGKTVDIISSKPLEFNIPLIGTNYSTNSAYSTEWLRCSSLCFKLPYDAAAQHVTTAFEYENFAGSLVPTKVNVGMGYDIDPEFGIEETDSNWKFMITDDTRTYAANDLSIDHEHAGTIGALGHNCVAVRVTATPSGIWDFYDEDRGTVDDNGYYKVVAVYGENSFSADLDSPILVHNKSELSSNSAKRLFTTPHQNHRVYNRDIMLSDKDYKGREFTDIEQYFKQVKIGNKWEDAPCYAPSVTKVMLHRCDSDGNLYPDWTGFWAVDSIQKKAVVENLTQGFSTKDINNSMCGPYRAAPIGVEVSEIELDFTAPSGIYYFDENADVQPYYVDVRIEYKKQGDIEWQHRDITLTSQGIKKFSNGEYTSTGMDAVGVTEKFDLPQGDWIFRCYKLTPEHTDDTTKYHEEVHWTGLKSVIANPQSYDHITTLLMRFEGNETLSEMNQNQISTMFTRKLPNIYTDELETTRNLAPVVKYICDNSKFAQLLSIENIQELDAIWKVRGMRCNGTLDTDNTLLQVLQDILHIGYSELCTRADKLELVMINKQALGTVSDVIQSCYSIDNFDFLFTPQNYSNLTMNVMLPKLDDIEEIAVTYTDVDTYKTATAYVHIDTVYSSSNYNKIVVTDYATSKHSETLETFGVTDKTLAVSMAARRLRSLKRQRIQITIDTEFDSLNCNYKDFVGIALDGKYAAMFSNNQMTYVYDESYMDSSPGNVAQYKYTDSNLYNYTGRVVNVNNKVITVSPAYIGRSGSSLYEYSLFITDQEGQPHLCKVDRWLTDTTVRLENNLPFEYDPDVEKPRVSMGFIVPCWVQSIKPSEKKCTVTLVNYDRTVFQDDLPMREGYGVSLYGGSPYGKSY